MNPLVEEYLVEEQRKDIEHELSDIRLQKQALNSKVFHPNWFTYFMQKLGQWLIMRGERLVKRYEVPSNRKTSSKQRYAH